MNKNQRIAVMLQHISHNFAGISNQMAEIRKIILEPESVTPRTPAQPEWNPAQSKPQTAGIPKRAEFVSDNRKTVDWKNQIAATYAQHEPHTIIPPTTSKASGNAVMEYYEKKVEQKLTKPETQAITYDNTITVPEPTGRKDWPNSRTVYTIIHGETGYLKVIHRNYRTTYYKITSGPDKGAVLSVNNKSKKVVEDGRYDGKYKSNNANRLAVVSVDQDGKDYVNRVIRQKKGILGGKLVRMYRPNPPNWNSVSQIRKPITHCAIYERKG